MRPNFWPNTPDILSGPLRVRTAVGLRRCGWCWPPPWPRPTACTAATSCTRTCRRRTDNEEYLDSEKYEIKDRDYDRPGQLGPAHDRAQRYPARATRLCSACGSIRFHPIDQPARDRLLQG